MAFPRKGGDLGLLPTLLFIIAKHYNINLQFSMPLVADMDIQSSGSDYKWHYQFFYLCLKANEKQ